MELAFVPDVKGLKASLTSVQRKQFPFAMAKALTATAGHAGIGWQKAIEATFENPTPFTVNSVAVVPARKAHLTATILVKDIAAAYLEPFTDGGKHALGSKKAILSPKNVGLNSYGNIPRGKIAALKAKPDVFVGAVKLKSGAVVSGVWQRGPRGERRKGGYGSKGSHHIKHNEKMGLVGYNNRTTLKLLVRFTDPLPVDEHLDVLAPTRRAIADHFETEFAKALNYAMATAK